MSMSEQLLESILSNTDDVEQPEPTGLIDFTLLDEHRDMMWRYADRDGKKSTIVRVLDINFCARSAQVEQVMDLITGETSTDTDSPLQEIVPLSELRHVEDQLCGAFMYLWLRAITPDAKQPAEEEEKQRSKYLFRTTIFAASESDAQRIKNLIETYGEGLLRVVSITANHAIGLEVSTSIPFNEGQTVHDAVGAWLDAMEEKHGNATTEAS